MRNHSFARDTSFLMLGGLVSQSLSILVFPLLSRFYSAEALGLQAIFVCVVSLTATLVTLRFEATIPVQGSEDEARSLLRLTFLTCLMVGTAASLGAWFFPTSWKEVLGVAVLGHWLHWAILSGFAGGVSAGINGWFHFKGDYKKMALLRLAQGSSLSLLSVTFGFMGVKNGLLLSQVVSSILSVILFSAALFGAQSGNLRANLRANFLAVAARHRDSPKCLLPTALLDVLTTQVPVVLISIWYGTREAGQFSMAWRVLAMPSSLVGVAVGQVFIHRFSQAWPDRTDASRLLFKTWAILAGLSLLPTITCNLYGSGLFPLIFGETWKQAGEIAAVLCWLSFFSFISSPTSGTYLVMGMQHHSLLFGLIVLLTRPMSFYLGVLYGDLLTGVGCFVVVDILVILAYQVAALRRLLH